MARDPSTRPRRTRFDARGRPQAPPPRAYRGGRGGHGAGRLRARADRTAAAHPPYFAGLQPGRHPAVRHQLPAAGAAPAAGRTQPGQGHLRASPRPYRLQVPGPPGPRLHRGGAGAEPVPADRRGRVFARRRRELVQSRIRARARRLTRHREGLLSERGQQRRPLRARDRGRGRRQGSDAARAARRAEELHRAAPAGLQPRHDRGVRQRPPPVADRAQPQDSDRDRRGARLAAARADARRPRGDAHRPFRKIRRDPRHRADLFVARVRHW